VAGHQRVLVVSTAAAPDDLGLRGRVDRDPVVLGAPGPAVEQVARVLRAEPVVEPLLGPVSRPRPDRGHRVDELVRRHALRDRFRDVVVVTDPGTAVLLLRVLAPDQLPSGGPVTVVGLPRGDRPVSVRRAVLTALALAAAAGASDGVVPLLALPAAVVALGLVLLLVPPWRHVGRELLLTAAVAVLVLFAAIAGSARFPAAW
jgi:hypothetical protein